MWQVLWQWKSYSPGLSATKSGTRLPMCASTGAVSLTAASGAVANLEEVAVKVQGVRHRTLVLEVNRTCSSSVGLISGRVSCRCTPGFESAFAKRKLYRRSFEIFAHSVSQI